MWQIYPGYPFILKEYEAKFYVEVVQAMVDNLLETEDTSLKTRVLMYLTKIRNAI